MTEPIREIDRHERSENRAGCPTGGDRSEGTFGLCGGKDIDQKRPEARDGEEAEETGPDVEDADEGGGFLESGEIGWERPGEPSEQRDEDKISDEKESFSSDAPREPAVDGSDDEHEDEGGRHDPFELTFGDDGGEGLSDGSSTIPSKEKKEEPNGTDEDSRIW